MEWKNLGGIKNFFKSIFVTNPIAVDAPKAVYMDFKDAGRVLMSYDVEVKYEDDVKRTFSFSVEERKLGLSPRRRALKRAIDFYRKKKIEIEKNKNSLRQRVI